MQFRDKLSVKETQKYLLRLLAFENANEDCHMISCPITEKEDVMGYCKTCQSVGSIKY